MLWDEAVLIHFTVKKPRSSPDEHCHEDCQEWEVLEVCFLPHMYIISPGVNCLHLWQWYGQYFREMRAYYGWDNELPDYQ
jgi:hypothetical protein